MYLFTKASFSLHIGTVVPKIYQTQLGLSLTHLDSTPLNQAVQKTEKLKFWLSR